MQLGFITREFLLFLTLKENLADYLFTCDEDSKCVSVLWVTQTEYASCAPELTNFSHAATRDSTFKWTMLKNSSFF